MVRKNSVQRSSHKDWIGRFVSSMEATLPHLGFSPSDKLHGSHVDLEAFPVLQLNALYSDLFVEKFLSAAKAADKKKIPVADLAATLSPTAIRKAMFYLFLDAEVAKLSKMKKRELAEFLYELLWISTVDDEFSLDSNVNLGEMDLHELVGLVKWNRAASDAERAGFGNLVLACKSVSESLYSYYHSEISYENYGPYDVSQYFGDGRSLIVTDCRDLKPVDLWPHARDYPYKSLRLFAVYKDAGISLNAFNQMKVGARLSEGLTHYAVVADSKPVGSADVGGLSRELGEIAAQQYLRFSDLFLEELKRKMVEARSYGFREFFSLLGLDWRPSIEMLARVKSRQIFPLPFTEDKFSSSILSNLK